MGDEKKQTTTGTPKVADPWIDYRAMIPREQQWLIEGLLPANSLACLYGKRGQGKTFVALDWACSIASGKNWLGRKTRRGRVAYILAERPEGLHRRIRGWFRRHGLADDEGADLISEGDIPRLLFAQHRFALDTEEDCKGLVGLLETRFGGNSAGTGASANWGLDLLILDPLVFFMDGSENETRHMQAFVNGAIKVSTEAKCAILLIHHEGKGNIQNVLGARGSSALEAGMDTVFYLSPQRPDDVSILSVTKQRDAKAAQPMLLHFQEQKDPKSGQDLGIYPLLPSREILTRYQKTGDAKDRKSRLIKIDEDHVFQAASHAQSDGKPITIAEIERRLPKDKYKGQTNIRDLIHGLHSTKRLTLIEEGKGRKPAVYSRPEPEHREPDRPETKS